MRTTLTQLSQPPCWLPWGRWSGCLLEAVLNFAGAKSLKSRSQSQLKCPPLAFCIVCLGAHLHALPFKDRTCSIMSACYLGGGGAVT